MQQRGVGLESAIQALSSVYYLGSLFGSLTPIAFLIVCSIAFCRSPFLLANVSDYTGNARPGSSLSVTTAEILNPFFRGTCGKQVQMVPGDLGHLLDPLRKILVPPQ